MLLFLSLKAHAELGLLNGVLCLFIFLLLLGIGLGIIGTLIELYRTHVGQKNHRAKHT